MTGATILALRSVAGSADDDDVDSAPSGDDADGSMDTGEGEGRGDDGDEVCAGKIGLQQVRGSPGQSVTHAHVQTGTRMAREGNGYVGTSMFAGSSEAEAVVPPLA